MPSGYAVTACTGRRRIGPRGDVRPCPPQAAIPAEPGTGSWGGQTSNVATFTSEKLTRQDQLTATIGSQWTRQVNAPLPSARPP
jgi:hypothetical protein